MRCKNCVERDMNSFLDFCEVLLPYVPTNVARTHSLLLLREIAE